ncbi:TetR/AcrR family transcriptional regulator [Paraconexibacter sp.]|uniref:TetR/AcrR family transcriptional regulator n=1 Tax=Paraconexibacter sp. TaxID=2949640 RepID=UPI003568D5EF
MASAPNKKRVSRAGRRPVITATLSATVTTLLADGERWTDLSIERICAESGVARSTFYLFFEDQGHLLTELADDALEAITGAGEGWWSLPRDATRADLEKAVEDIFVAYAEHGLLLTAVVEAAAYDGRVREHLEDSLEHSFAAVTQHITTAQNDGWMDPGLDADTIAHWLSWMGESGLRALVHRGERPTRRLIEAYAGIVWNVLYTFDR